MIVFITSRDEKIWDVKRKKDEKKNCCDIDGNDNGDLCDGCACRWSR